MGGQKLLKAVRSLFPERRNRDWLQPGASSNKLLQNFILFSSKPTIILQIGAYTACTYHCFLRKKVCACLIDFLQDFCAPFRSLPQEFSAIFSKVGCLQLTHIRLLLRTLGFLPSQLGIPSLKNHCAEFFHCLGFGKQNRMFFVEIWFTILGEREFQAMQQRHFAHYY